MDAGLPGGVGTSVPRRPKWLRTLWRRLVRPAELSLLVLLATGLLMFDPLRLPWSVVSWGLIAHVVAAIVLVPAILVPFWISHRDRLQVTRRRLMALSGRTLEIGLGLLLATGLFLWLVGQNGTALGAAMHWAHLVLAVPLVLLVVVHAWKRSTIRLVVGVGSMAVVLMGMTSPTLEPGGPLHAVESRSLLLEAGGRTLLAANFDGGSVSRIDRASGRRLDEAVLGGDITSLAVDSDDHLVAATDFTGDELSLLDADSLSIRRQVKIADRPAGIVYDARNRLFWIAATEGNRLYGVAPDGTVRIDMAVAESPRGLALLPDGRLLVSHAMIGAVSIYDTTKLPLRRTRFIRLAVEQDPDQTVSQGLPRGLDRIEVSPDGKQAWLPHVLWNFDHPFQFQSTVFPAISVLALAPGDEHEAVSQRKQLFRQINIIEDGNRTRIVSNPADVGFSDDGSKAYVTMSGSEDLVVFDLARALPIDSTSKKARTTQGAQAVQIFRHLPGQNPRGIVVDGGDIYVQNAMSLDLSKLSTGGDGQFASVAVVAPQFARLVGKDPLAPALRRGERIFDLADTAQFPDAPVTGDNWMSCSSCHVDGFNFTNRALFQATPVDKFHSAFTGHGTIMKLVAGDFVGDYIRMIRDTQGGMGADTRFPTPQTDPDHPSPAVVAMMKDLHAFVTSPGNLPLFATWLRGKDGGGSVDPDAWANSALCASCHSGIFKQWSNSMHHFMGQSDPYYVVLEDLAAKDVGEPFRAWCMGCHEPQALLSGQTRTTGVARLFDHDGQSLYADLMTYAHTLDEGTGCLFCHTVTRIEDAGGTLSANASLNVDPEDRPTVPGEMSDFAPLRAFASQLIRAKPDVHAAAMMQNIRGNADLCAACHEEFAPGTGSYIIDTYAEWQASPFNAPDDPSRNRTCMDCHMHASVARIGTPVPGQSTDGGPMEPNVVTHQFVGAQYHLVGLHDPAAEAETIALLKTSAKLSLPPAKPGQVTVRVSNVGAGHDLPTGVSDFREMWLAVTVTDATGRPVLSSGQLAANGDLDPEARTFHKVMGALDAHSIEPLFWRFMRMTEDTRIPAGGFRDESFNLPAGTVYPVRVDARLMFRTFPQQITDLVRQRFPQMPPPQPVEMARLTQNLTSSPGQP